MAYATPPLAVLFKRYPRERRTVPSCQSDVNAPSIHTVQHSHAGRSVSSAVVYAQDAKIPLKGIMPIPGGLKGATPAQIAATLAKCRKIKMHGKVCLALKARP